MRHLHDGGVFGAKGEEDERLPESSACRCDTSSDDGGKEKQKVGNPLTLELLKIPQKRPCERESEP